MSKQLVYSLFLLLLIFKSNRCAYTEDELASVPPVDYSLANSSRSDIIFVLFTETTQNQSDGLVLNEAEVGNARFNRSHPTKLIFHGYTTSMNSPWYEPLRDAYLQKGPHNIIYVDWSAPANMNFTVSAANCDPVGEYVADFLIASKIPPENIHLIGHSLGSHLTGYIGKHYMKKINKKIERITALDPAGPAFDKTPQELRLNSSDAAFVDVIHTDIGYFGFTKPMGHVDFYPNGGKDQPGCLSHEEDENASHARSTLFFIESVTSRSAKATKAVFKGKNQILPLKDAENESVIFGDGVSTAARGVYYIKTAPNPPFLLS